MAYRVHLALSAALLFVFILINTNERVADKAKSTSTCMLLILLIYWLYKYVDFVRLIYVYVGMLRPMLCRTHESYHLLLAKLHKPTGFHLRMQFL